jgi:hypothetical protein
MNPITEAKVAADCRPGKGADTCAFLVLNGGGWHCGKTDRNVVAAIRARLEAGTMNARGDNCEGAP